MANCIRVCGSSWCRGFPTVRFLRLRACVCMRFCFCPCVRACAYMRGRVSVWACFTCVRARYVCDVACAAIYIHMHIYVYYIYVRGCFVVSGSTKQTDRAIYSTETARCQPRQNAKTCQPSRSFSTTRFLHSPFCVKNLHACPRIHSCTREILTAVQ